MVLRVACLLASFAKAAQAGLKLMVPLPTSDYKGMPPHLLVSSAVLGVESPVPCTLGKLSTTESRPQPPTVFSRNMTHSDAAWSSLWVGRPWWLLRRERRNVGGPDGSGTCWACTRERWA